MVLIRTRAYCLISWATVRAAAPSEVPQKECASPELPRTDLLSLSVREGDKSEDQISHNPPDSIVWKQYCCVPFTCCQRFVSPTSSPSTAKLVCSPWTPSRHSRRSSSSHVSGARRHTCALTSSGGILVSIPGENMHVTAGLARSRPRRESSSGSLVGSCETSRSCIKTLPRSPTETRMLIPEVVVMTGPLLGFGCAVLVSTNASPWYQENAPGLIRTIGALMFPVGRSPPSTRGAGQTS